jgi:hypothetical protein
LEKSDDEGEQQSANSVMARLDILAMPYWKRAQLPVSTLRAAGLEIIDGAGAVQFAGTLEEIQAYRNGMKGTTPPGAGTRSLYAYVK